MVLVDIDWNTMATCSNFYFLTAFYMLNRKRIIKFMISEWDLLLLLYYLLRVECNIHMQTTNLHLKKQYGMWEISNRLWIYSIVIGWNNWKMILSTSNLLYTLDFNCDNNYCILIDVYKEIKTNHWLFSKFISITRIYY